MRQTWRWFGPVDKVTIADARQVVHDRLMGLGLRRDWSTKCASIITDSASLL